MKYNRNWALGVALAIAVAGCTEKDGTESTSSPAGNGGNTSDDEGQAGEQGTSDDDADENSVAGQPNDDPPSGAGGARPAPPAAGGAPEPPAQNGGGPGSTPAEGGAPPVIEPISGVCSPTCLKDCAEDNDCDVADGELCCDYGADGRACVPAAQCPRWCSDDSECNIDDGQACGPVLVSSDTKVCTSPTQIALRCPNGDDDCADGDKCCTIYDEPVCLAASLCPATCTEGADCNSAAGEVCCQTLNQVDPGLSATGLCVHPSLVSCPQTCSQSTECDTESGEICCEGICSTACASSCETSNDCPGEICCKSAAARSPFRLGERVGYPVLDVPQVSCDDTCIYAFDNVCEDGSVAGSTILCAAGTDCTDCGNVVQPGLCTNTCLYVGDGFCDDGRIGASTALCSLGTDCSDCGAAPTPVTPALCSDTCLYSVNGSCDDGGVGASTLLCSLGTDCFDCGTR